MMKFKVNSEGHSDAIQKQLFKLGYSWSGTSKEIIKGKNYLFSDEKDLSAVKKWCVKNLT